MKILGDIATQGAPPVSTTPLAKFATSSAGVVDTVGKFATGVNDTGGKFATGVNDAGGIFATRINDTGGKFATCVNNTSDEQYQTTDNLK